MTALVSSRRIPSGSVEFLTAWIDSDSDGSEGVTLSAQPVAIALQPIGSSPDEDTTWRTATWTGSPGTGRAAAILVGPGTTHVIPVGHYDVWGTITDNPEIPLVYCGRLRIY
jgi:hypothetical protein